MFYGYSDAEKEPYDEEHHAYFPPELINILQKSNTYHFYVIELLQHFSYDIQVQGVVLAMRSKLEEPGLSFDLQAERGMLTANFKYTGFCSLTEDQVLSFALCYFDINMIKGVTSSCSS